MILKGLLLIYKTIINEKTLRFYGSHLFVNFEQSQQVVLSTNIRLRSFEETSELLIKYFLFPENSLFK